MVKPESSDPCPTTHRSDEPVGDISEYELQRLDNIRRNEEFLKTLGFEAVKAKKESSTGPKVSRKRKSEDSYFPTESIEYREPSRRSRRIQQQEAELIDGNPSELPRPPKERRILEDIDVEILIDDENTLRTKITAPELQAFIEERSAEHYELIGNDIIEHTAYRMSYMSNAKLATRLKMIARAAGKNSCSKLLAFYYGLKLAKLEMLSDSTKEALSGCGVYVP